MRPTLGRTALAIAAAAALTAAMVTPSQADASAATYFTLKNQDSGLCLDSNLNGSVYTMRCNGGHYQQWRFVDGQTTRQKLYKNRATGLCLINYMQNGVETGTCDATWWKQNWDSYSDGRIVCVTSSGVHWTLYDKRNSTGVFTTSGSVTPLSAAKWTRRNV
ncbi:hypothetical protein GCM10010412_080410 [Nonomuraea recticatena]|uniref:Ricin B lectin domain-containing protein n=1 Tax=Nonomuraea recticatena TaxID=46178 RepID=A0ABP6FKE7_9ACTN